MSRFNLGLSRGHYSLCNQQAKRQMQTKDSGVSTALILY
jgi:hypothetical protein